MTPNLITRLKTSASWLNHLFPRVSGEAKKMEVREGWVQAREKFQGAAQKRGSGKVKLAAEKETEAFNHYDRDERSGLKRSLMSTKIFGGFSATGAGFHTTLGQTHEQISRCRGVLDTISHRARFCWPRNSSLQSKLSGWCSSPSS